MTLFAITGGTGCGKSTVCELLKNYGLKIIEVDSLVRNIVPTDEDFTFAEEIFGRSIRTEGQLDLSKFREALFQNRIIKLRWEKFFSQTVWPLLQEEINGSDPSKIILVESAVLCEMELCQKFDYVIVAKSDIRTRIHRLTTFRGLSKGEAIRRMRSQIPEFVKQKTAQLCIDTNCCENLLRDRVDNLYRQIITKALID